MNLFSPRLIRSTSGVLLSLLTSQPLPVTSKAFLGDYVHDTGMLNTTFRAAAEAVLGCRNPGDKRPAVAGQRIIELEASLTPLWQKLPKSKDDRVEWRMLRYMANRYFMKQSGILVRGFDPLRHSGDAMPYVAAADDYAFLTDLLNNSRHQNIGYTLRDAAAMVATIEQLIFNSEDRLLHLAYSLMDADPSHSLPLEELTGVMEAYLGLWILSDGQNVELASHFVTNPTQRAETFPMWASIHHFGLGVLKEFQFLRQRDANLALGSTVLENTFSFDDVHAVVGRITKTFALFWEEQCQDIKNSLTELDPGGSGRVSLSRFYRARQRGEWRFGESETYLRDLGILDESSAFTGLVIPNYIQGISNCIVSNANYHVCCMNECEEKIHVLEEAVGGPVASPEEILRTVEREMAFEDDALHIKASLRQQLRRLADTHGGKVPLHGRLFAHWLHRVFPQECPVPHKAGFMQSTSMLEAGEAAFASAADVQRHASAAELQQATGVEEMRMLSPWEVEGEQEELLADYALHLGGGWESSNTAWLLLSLTGVLALVSGFASSYEVALRAVTALLSSTTTSGKHETGCGHKVQLV